MTIQAPLPDRTPPASPLRDLPTDGMESRRPFIVDAFSFLHHRARERLIPLAGAPDLGP